MYKNLFFFLTGLWGRGLLPDDDFDNFETGHIGALEIWTVAEVSLSTQEIKKVVMGLLHDASLYGCNLLSRIKFDFEMGRPRGGNERVTEVSLHRRGR